jgi:hypothetical protein
MVGVVTLEAVLHDYPYFQSSLKRTTVRIKNFTTGQLMRQQLMIGRHRLTNQPFRKPFSLPSRGDSLDLSLLDLPNEPNTFPNVDLRFFLPNEKDIKTMGQRSRLTRQGRQRDSKFRPYK